MAIQHYMSAGGDSREEGKAGTDGGARANTRGVHHRTVNSSSSEKLRKWFVGMQC